MPILTKDEISRIPQLIGVYRIYAKTQNNVPIPITRFCGTDHSGLLYIGQTSGQNLRIRLYQFYASSNTEMLTRNHSGGLKYCNNPIIRETLGENHLLYFDYELNEKPNKREEQLLQEYITEFGEYPPLNK